MRCEGLPATGSRLTAGGAVGHGWPAAGGRPIGSAGRVSGEGVEDGSGARCRHSMVGSYVPWAARPSLSRSGLDADPQPSSCKRQAPGRNLADLREAEPSWALALCGGVRWQCGSGRRWGAIAREPRPAGTLSEHQPASAQWGEPPIAAVIIASNRCHRSDA